MQYYIKLILIAYDKHNGRLKMIRCNTCCGAKTVSELGGISKTCKTCEGVGYVTLKELDSNDSQQSISIRAELKKNLRDKKYHGR